MVLTVTHTSTAVIIIITVQLTEKSKSGSVASRDLQPGNGVDLCYTTDID